MSIIDPEIEYVDRATESIRYLEHGWPTHLCRWHAHEEYELHLIVNSGGKAFVGDYIGEFKPGSLFLTGPHLPHNWITYGTASVSTRDMLVQFHDASVRQLQSAFPEFSSLRTMLEQSRSGIEFVGFDLDTAKSLMAAVRDSSGPEQILAFIRLLLTVNNHEHKNTLATSVTSDTGTAVSGKHDRIGAVVDHVVEHYPQALNLVTMADMAGMSASAFSRNFQAVTGNKFVEFVNRVRIGQACSLLYSTEHQIASICFEVGFQNLANFNRQFLRLKGMTPSEYRDLARRDLAKPEQVA